MVICTELPELWVRGHKKMQLLLVPLPCCWVKVRESWTFVCLRLQADSVSLLSYFWHLLWSVGFGDVSMKNKKLLGKTVNVWRKVNLNKSWPDSSGHLGLPASFHRGETNILDLFLSSWTLLYIKALLDSTERWLLLVTVGAVLKYNMDPHDEGLKQ